MVNLILFIEQIIPLESTPRNLASLITIPLGITAPTLATTTFCSAATLGAPQTICKVSLPTLTFKTLNLSASGCFSLVSTYPTTNLGDKSVSN